MMVWPARVAGSGVADAHPPVTGSNRSTTEESLTPVSPPTAYIRPVAYVAAASFSRAVDNEGLSAEPSRIVRHGQAPQQ